MMVKSIPRELYRTYMASVSVIVPASGQAARLRHVLKDLEAQTLRPMEVIVVTSANQTELEHQLDLANLQARVIGVAHGADEADALNVGVSSSHGDLVVVHPENVSWAPTVLESATDWLQSHPAMDAVGVSASTGESAVSGSAAPLVYRRTSHAVLGYYRTPEHDHETVEENWLRRLSGRNPVYALPNTVTGHGEPRLLLDGDSTSAEGALRVTKQGFARVRSLISKTATAVASLFRGGSVTGAAAPAADSVLLADDVRPDATVTGRLSPSSFTTRDAAEEQEVALHSAVRIGAVALGVVAIAAIALTSRRRGPSEPTDV
ncbi:glycosyltransferase family 2 protein [Pseudoclavibacter sp. CFCC 13796]|nr:glycosyltransferase family 2 protein [Pseudoclavibacter sp. CFCC 13796]